MQLASLAFILFLFLGAFESHTRQERAAHFFTEALSEAGVDEYVFVRNKTYDIREGRVFDGTEEAGYSSYLPLRIVYAAALARRSPLLPSGIDPSELDAAIEILEETRLALGDAQDTGSSARLVQDLYPLTFLRSLAKSERARKKFLALPSSASAALYEQSLRRATDAYESDLVRYRNAFKKAVPLHSAQFIAGETVISRDIILSVTSSFRERLEDVRDELKGRSLCLSGHTAYCKTDELKLHVPSPVERKQAVDLSFVEDVRSLLSEARQDPDLETLPIIELASSVCVEDLPALPVFVVNPSPGNALFIGDIVFAPAKRYAEQPYFRHFLREGVDYVYLPTMAFYKCPEMAIDYGALFGALAVRELASKRLSTHATGTEGERLVALEERLKGSFIREYDTALYLSEALEIESLPRDLRSSLEEVAVLYTSKSGGFIPFIRHVAVLQRSVLALETKGIPIDHLDASYLFFVRSGFFGFFLGWNFQGAALPRVHLAPEEKPFVLYSDIRSTISREELVRQIASVHETIDPRGSNRPVLRN